MQNYNCLNTSNCASEFVSSLCILCNTNCTTHPLECGHSFHQECIFRWFMQVERRCPLCKLYAGLDLDTYVGNVNIGFEFVKYVNSQNSECIREYFTQNRLAHMLLIRSLRQSSTSGRSSSTKKNISQENERTQPQHRNDASSIFTLSPEKINGHMLEFISFVSSSYPEIIDRFTKICRSYGSSGRVFILVQKVVSGGV